MVVNLKPFVQFETKAEKHCFESCLDSIQQACRDMCGCDGCPWQNFCQYHLTKENMVTFISNFKMLVLNCEIEEEEEEW